MSSTIPSGKEAPSARMWCSAERRTRAKRNILGRGGNILRIVASGPPTDSCHPLLSCHPHDFNQSSVRMHVLGGEKTNPFPTGSEVLTVTQSLLSHGPNLPVRALVRNALSAALPTVGICRNVRLSEHQTVGMSHRRTVNVRNVPLSATLDIDTLRRRLCVSLLSFPCQVPRSAGKKAPAQGIIKLFLERKEFWYFKPVKGLGRQTAGRKRGMATCRPICSHKDSALCLRSFLARLSMPSHCRFESLFPCRHLSKKEKSACFEFVPLRPKGKKGGLCPREKPSPGMVGKESTHKLPDAEGETKTKVRIIQRPGKIHHPKPNA